MVRLISLHFVLLVLVACGGSETHTAPVPVQAAADAPEDLEALGWLGGRAMANIVVRPDRWTEVRDSIRAALDQVPQELEPLLSAPTFDQALSRVYPAASLGSGLPGLDPARPVLARLFEPSQPVTFDQVMNVARGNGAASMHHWIFLPVTDGVALRGALLERLSEMCRPSGEHLQCEQRRVALLEVDEWVVIAIGTHELPRRTDRNALGWAFGEPAAIQIRFEAIHEVTPLMGATLVADALRSVDPTYREDMLSVATSEMLTAHLHTHAWQEELDSLVVAVTTEPFGLIGAARLTERGAALPLQRGSATPAVEGPLVIRTGFDLDALREGSPIFDTATAYDSPGDLAHSMQVCGWGCMAHSVAMPFTTARMMREMEAFTTEEIGFVVDESLDVGEITIDAQLDAMPRPLRELGDIVPHARLHARRDGAYWVASLGFPEPPSLEGLAPPNVEVAARVRATDEEKRCVVAMTVEAIEGLRAAPRADESLRPRIHAELTALRDSLGSRCGNGELARTERENVRAALSIIP